MPTAETLLSIDLPLSSAGTPLPHVFADEGKLLIAYLINRPDTSFDGKNPRSVSAATSNQSVAILTADLIWPFSSARRTTKPSAGTVCMSWVCGHMGHSKFSTHRGSLPWRTQIGFTHPTGQNCFPTIGISSLRSKIRRLSSSLRVFRAAFTKGRSCRH